MTTSKRKLFFYEKYKIFFILCKKKLLLSGSLIVCLGLQFHTSAQVHLNWAKTPPMGWNSFDSFGATVNEEEVKGNAKMMEVHLKDFGWEYIVIDYCWFYPYIGALNNPSQSEDFKPSLPMDEYGRLLPAVDRFPSSANGVGFRETGDFIHSLGLKFGIHIMRGIPREAVAKKMPVKGTVYTADQITDYSTCSWLNSMYGLDMNKPGAQEYYNSLFELYASWGVDYVKVDDISYPYRELEIEGIRKAIDNCGRKIVLSLSPGDATPPHQAEHLKRNANVWRISADFWDNWDHIKKQFFLAQLWEEHISPGHWPDLDMIPFGVLNRRGPGNGLERDSRFTLPEKYSLMTLWSITRSPLMYGGDLMLIRPAELSLLTNKEVLAVNRFSENNRQLFKKDDIIAWTADIPESDNKYLAVFNTGENPDQKIKIDLSLLGYDISEKVSIRDLWKRENTGNYSGEFIIDVEAHGARLFRISKYLL